MCEANACPLLYAVMSESARRLFMQGGIRVHYGHNNKVELLFCESRSCQYGKIDDAYSWEHVTVLGWALKRADMWGDEKASGTNKELSTSGGEPLEIYCPLCSKDLRS